MTVLSTSIQPISTPTASTQTASTQVEVSTPLFTPARQPCQATLLLAHGAGESMHSPFMTAMAEGLAQQGIQVIRFNFPYMQRACLEGQRRPPDRQPILIDYWHQMIDQAPKEPPLWIGGKSMGGRMAVIASQAQAHITGVIALGYPFHPPGKPDKTRLLPLHNASHPLLITQGTRDPFGRPDDVASYELPSPLQIHWIEAGDHSFIPTKRSGRTTKNCWDEAIERNAQFILQHSHPHNVQHSHHHNKSGR